MRVIISMILTVCFCIAFPGILAAAPEVKVISSRNSVQKGNIFEIRVEIAAREAVSDIVVAPLIPVGFTLHPILSHGIEAEKDKDTVRLSHLTAGSSFAIVFRGEAPAVIGKSRVSTAEAKIFGFNISYLQDGSSDPKPSSQFISTTIHYTTHISIYLGAGILGTILGFLIKTGIKKREELSSTMQTTGGAKGAAAAFRELLKANSVGLITVLIIGFGALLVLAKEGIPVAGWQQAIALGIGLAVLTDDQLLSKFTGGK